MLRIHDLSKRYWTPQGEIVVVDSVSFEVAAKQAIAIVGQSGAGKSTVAKCIVGVENPSDGRIWFDDLEVTTLAPTERRSYWKRVQMIWQDPFLALSPHRRIWQIIGEPLANYTEMDKGQIRGKVDQLLSLVGLDFSLAQKYTHQLSGGQCQRVSIARALALEPSLLICDEPVSALDLPMQLKIMDLIDGLRRHLGLAVILITHDIGLAHRYCNAVAIMHKGKVVEKGTPDAVLRQSVHPYTKSLVEAIPRLPWENGSQIAAFNS